MLRVDKIEVHYGETPALHKVSLKVRKGEIVALLGSNGAGKSTTLKTIGGLLTPVSGNIEFNGVDITKKDSSETVKMGITYVPQERRIFGPLTVRENLSLGAYGTDMSKEEEEDIMESVYDLFPRVKDREDQEGRNLSGGEQKMLAIGRGLMAKPKLLMIDELSLGLMPKLMDEVFDSVRVLKEKEYTTILVDQNVEEVLKMSDRGYIIQSGRITYEGSGEDLLSSDIIKRSFLGI